MTKLRIGISTCPNDTFAFAHWIERHVELAGVEIDWTFADVEQLNRAALAGELDVFKISYAAALAMSSDVRILPSGSALGFGVGPVVLARPGGVQTGETPRVFAPGEHTTATLLWHLFHPEPVKLQQVTFSEIMPALAAGRADLGVCIHEGRFTYRDAGLELVEDLGATWESSADAPLPLGGIGIGPALDAELGTRIAATLRASIEAGFKNRRACLPLMQHHAQEHDEATLWKHVELYVNDFTLDLGPSGRRAIAELGRRAQRRQLLASPDLLILDT